MVLRQRDAVFFLAWSPKPSVKSRVGWRHPWDALEKFEARPRRGKDVDWDPPFFFAAGVFLFRVALFRLSQLHARAGARTPQSVLSRVSSRMCVVSSRMKQVYAFVTSEIAGSKQGAALAQSKSTLEAFCSTFRSGFSQDSKG